jgi:hypothetical protein
LGDGNISRINHGAVTPVMRARRFKVVRFTINKIRGGATDGRKTTTGYLVVYPRNRKWVILKTSELKSRRHSVYEYIHYELLYIHYIADIITIHYKSNIV